MILSTPFTCNKEKDTELPYHPPADLQNLKWSAPLTYIIHFLVRNEI